MDSTKRNEYLDGCEAELLDIVSKYKVEEYSRIIEEKNDDKIMYHLSDKRQNVVEWLQIPLDSCVLEIGAECGAITSSLVSKANKVDCIELSKVKSEINEKRHCNADNLSVYVGTYDEVENNLVDNSYDYVFIVGTLKYASRYIDSRDPYSEMIKKTKNKLKVGGKIVIAIDNKYGLKYWAGCKEEHTQKYFANIEGYVGVDDAKTFSKQGLEKMITSAGFSNINCYYPYPDYRYMVELFSDEFLPQKGTLVNNFRNFDFERMMVFDESRAWDNIIDDNMFPFFSNSFLVIAEREE